MRRPGEELGGYVLVRQIGRGGMGTVYEAIDGALDPLPEALKSFALTIRLMAKALSPTTTTRISESFPGIKSWK